MQKRTYYIPTIEIMDLRVADVLMWELNSNSDKSDLGGGAPRRVERRDPAF